MWDEWLTAILEFDSAEVTRVFQYLCKSSHAELKFKNLRMRKYFLIISCICVVTGDAYRICSFR